MVPPVVIIRIFTVSVPRSIRHHFTLGGCDGNKRLAPPAAAGVICRLACRLVGLRKQPVDFVARRLTQLPESYR